MVTRRIMRTGTGTASRAPSGPGVRRLPAEVIALLEECTAEGQLIRLTRQLDKLPYLRLKRALEGMGGSWNRKLGGFWFPVEVAPLLAAATGDGWYIDPVQRHGQFDTPDDLADRLVAAAGIEVGDRVLEPSAGTGSLIRAILRAGAPASILAYEIDDARCAVLARLIADAAVTDPDTRVTVQPGDALAWIQLGIEHGCAPGPFDRIVMNPPFARLADAIHIDTVWPLLASGGRLAAICSEAPFHQDNRRAAAFRTFLANNDAEVTKLPPGSFRAAGTDVDCRMIVATRRARP